MDSIVIREATRRDVDFLVETIVESEKSGTDKLSYSTLFGLSEEEARIYIADMLLEEIDGCELSISSFLIAEINGQYAAAVAAWIEGVDNTSSNFLKRNLINYTLPKNCFEKAADASQVVRDLYIEADCNTIQIGMAYVSRCFRGLKLPGRLIEEQIKRWVSVTNNLSQVYLQVFADNQAAIHVYQNAGFEIVHENSSLHANALHYFPSNRKILMRKKLNNDGEV